MQTLLILFIVANAVFIGKCSQPIIQQSNSQNLRMQRPRGGHRLTICRLVELQRRDVVRRRHRFSGVFVGALDDFRPQGCRRLPRQDVQNRLAVFFVAKSEC